MLQFLRFLVISMPGPIDATYWSKLRVIVAQSAASEIATLPAGHPLPAYVTPVIKTVEGSGRVGCGIGEAEPIAVHRLMTTMETKYLMVKTLKGCQRAVGKEVF